MYFLYLSKRKPIKELTLKLKKTGGRNQFGRITSYQKGGGHSRRYKLINYFKKSNFFQNNLFIIRRFEYDPNRKVFLALICSEIGFLSYIIATDGMVIGQIIEFNLKNLLIFTTGARTEIQNYFLGNFLNNIESTKLTNSIYTRAAGTKSILLKKYHKNVLIRLSSRNLKLISNFCLASYGSINFSDFKLTSYRKAGQSRWLNKKPSVRGVAMNPVDHPHGGGEGKTSGGRCSVTPWGILTKGYPTVRGHKRKIKFLLKI